MTYDGQELYPTLADKAAILKFFHQLQPFVYRWKQAGQLYIHAAVPATQWL